MSKVPKIRSAYDGSRVSVVVKCGPSRVKQSLREQADVNSILARYARTGVWNRTARAPMFGDVSFVGSYHEALSRVMEAKNDARRLPGRARELYESDPERYLARVVSASDRDALVELGLLEPEVIEAPSGAEGTPSGEPVEPAAQ